MTTRTLPTMEGHIAPIARLLRENDMDDDDINTILELVDERVTKQMDVVTGQIVQAVIDAIESNGVGHQDDMPDEVEPPPWGEGLFFSSHDKTSDYYRVRPRKTARTIELFGSENIDRLQFAFAPLDEKSSKRLANKFNAAFWLIENPGAIINKEWVK
jgi:hypothetical protein